MEPMSSNPGCLNAAQIQSKTPFLSTIYPSFKPLTGIPYRGLQQLMFDPIKNVSTNFGSLDHFICIRQFL